MSDQKNKIRLGDFLKQENGKYYFALSGLSGQSEALCFQKVCDTSSSDLGLPSAKIEYPSSINVEQDKNFVAVVCSLNGSKDHARRFAEKLVNQTNEIINDPVVAEFLVLRREIPCKPYPDRKHFEKRCQELESNLRETDKYKFVGN
jgi:hypothetical protein